MKIVVTSQARDELRDRIAQHRAPSGVNTGVIIMGPMEEDSRAPDSVEEAWLLERAYGPAQRWVFHIAPMEVMSQAVDELEELHTEVVDGIHIGVITTKPCANLRVELHGDRIRIVEA